MNSNQRDPIRIALSRRQLLRRAAQFGVGVPAAGWLLAACGGSSASSSGGTTGGLAGDHDAYTYLPESVKRFPAPEALAARMATAGIGRIHYLMLAGGIIAIHSGVKEG